ncbi:MAG: hypothetical protein AAGU75_14670 [Bacillota bacterium]
MKLLISILIFSALIAISPNGYAGNIRFELERNDIRYVALSPKLLNEYHVVLELFGPIFVKLKKIYASHEDYNIEFTISDEVIAVQNISSTIESGLIGVGRWSLLSQAVAQAEHILILINKKSEPAP